MGTSAIRRPATYELKAESTVGDLVALGGGLLPEAAPRLATLERIASTIRVAFSPLSSRCVAASMIGRV